jgi:DNA modification methylase
MSESFHDKRVVLHCGDCLDVMPQLAENSIDACICDPPYHLTSIVKRFGADDAAAPQVKTRPYGGGFKEENGGTGAAFARMSRGFMGKQWDGGDIAFRVETWAAVYRVLKPGAYIVAFGGSRTFHRLGCAIEDAGFITHPLIGWITGQGFPKAHSVSKHIDRMAGAERKLTREGIVTRNGYGDDLDTGSSKSRPRYDRPATDAARQWDGWFYGTQSLKPAIEPIYVGQKPFEAGLNGTENVLKWGTGALNIGGCRVGCEATLRWGTGNDFGLINDDGWKPTPGLHGSPLGRWPANVVHDGSPEVLAAFPESVSGGGDKHGKKPSMFMSSTKHDQFLGTSNGGDSGSAARFFYTSKADAGDRIYRYTEDEKRHGHPTCKPVDLMRWLCRLVTPPNGMILDCFAGSGTTGEAAFHEGFRAVLIEKEVEYQDDIRRRMEMMHADRTERVRVNRNPGAKSTKCVWE